MTTWSDIARDSLEAAKVLLSRERWRSCVSRSYYAAFCVCQQRVEGRVKLPPRSWTFTHQRLPALIRRHADLPGRRPAEAAKLLGDLRDLRIHADYDRRHPFGRQEARGAVIAAHRLFQILEVPR